MEIYRIEQSNGKGICMALGSPLCPIYRLAARLAGEESEFERDRFPDRCEQCKAFDAVAFDPSGEFGREREHMRYAFPSLMALKEWFPGSEGRKAMQSAGAVGIAYDVPELVASGPWQCVFDLRRATEAYRFDLGTFDPIREPDPWARYPAWADPNR